MASTTLIMRKIQLRGYIRDEVIPRLWRPWAILYKTVTRICKMLVFHRTPSWKTLLYIIMNCHTSLYPENEQSQNKTCQCKTDITIFIHFKNCNFHGKFATDIYIAIPTKQLHRWTFQIFVLFILTASCNEEPISFLMLSFGL